MMIAFILCKSTEFCHDQSKRVEGEREMMKKSESGDVEQTGVAAMEPVIEECA